MVKSEAILNVCDQIAKEFQPAQIILFGSHARGNASDDSDVDMLVVMFKGTDGYKKAGEISDRIRPEFGFDLLVRTSAALQKRLIMNDFFVREIIDKGIVLHDAVNPRVGQQGRKRFQQRKPAGAST